MWGQEINEYTIDSTTEADPLLERMETMMAWGVKPHEWYYIPSWSQSFMIATLRTRRKMDYVGLKYAPENQGGKA